MPKEFNHQIEHHDFCFSPAYIYLVPIYDLSFIRETVAGLQYTHLDKDELIVLLITKQWLCEMLKMNLEN